MKKCFLILFVFANLFFHNLTNAQSGFKNVYFDSLVNHKAYEVLETSDGKYLVFGSRDPSDSINVGFTLVKLESNGDLIWAKDFYQLNSKCEASCVLETQAGEYLIHYSSTLMGSQFFSLLDTSGNIISTKEINNGGLHVYWGDRIRFDGSNYISCAISATSQIPGAIKFDSNLNVLWSNNYSISAPQFNNAYYCDFDSRGNLIVLATFDASALPCQQSGYVLLKIYPNGTLKWAKELCYNANAGHWINNLVCDRTNNDHIHLNGEKSGTNVQSNEHVELDSNGAVLSARNYSISGIVYFNVNSFLPSLQTFALEAQDANGFYANSFFKLNSAGQITIQKTYEDTLLRYYYPNAIESSDSGIIMSGYNFVNGGEQMEVVKVDSTLGLNCPQTTLTYFDSSISINTQSVSLSTSSIGITTTSHSNFLTVVPIHLNKIGTCSTIGIDEYDLLKQSFLLSPNPATTHLTLQLTNSSTHSGNYFITDLCGKQLKSGVLQANSAEVDVNSLAAGLYFVEIQTGEGRVTGKFVKGE